IVHMTVGVTSDPWAGYESWLETEGRERLADLWASLKPIDRIIIEHLAFAGVEDLFGAAFVAKANKALQPPSPLSAAKIQTAVKRLVKWDVLAPTGVEG